MIGSVTVFVWPAVRNTFWKPSSRLIGRSSDGAAFGVFTYISTISLPSREPVFVTSTLTWMVSSALGVWLEMCRCEKPNVV